MCVCVCVCDREKDRVTEATNLVSVMWLKLTQGTHLAFIL